MFATLVVWHYLKIHKLYNKSRYIRDCHWTYINIDDVVNYVTCAILQWGNAALHVAAFSGNVQVVGTLIKSGVHLNALDKVSKCVW